MGTILNAGQREARDHLAGWLKGRAGRAANIARLSGGLLHPAVLSKLKSGSLSMSLEYALLIENASAGEDEKIDARRLLAGQPALLALMDHIERRALDPLAWPKLEEYDFSLVAKRRRPIGARKTPLS